MTYTELSKIKTTGFVTNNVIDDVVNNGRACYTKAAFKKAKVSDAEVEKIMEWAAKEGCALFAAAQIAVNYPDFEGRLAFIHKFVSAFDPIFGDELAAILGGE